MKKCALYLCVTVCFLKAADLPKEEQRLHSVTEAHIGSIISRLNDPAIDATTLRKFWSMSDLTPSLRTPVGDAVRRKIAEPNADPAILQLARDIGKFYEDYPGLREEVATIIRSRLRAPQINLAILQVALSTAAFDPELYKQAATIVKNNIKGFDTQLGVLQLALDISIFDPELRQHIMIIIDGKIAGTTTDPFVLVLAWDTRNHALRQKVVPIVSNILSKNTLDIHPAILQLAWCMRLEHPELVAQTKSIVMHKLAESVVDANDRPSYDPTILQLAHQMSIS